VLEDRTDNSGNHTTTRFSYDGNQVWAELNTSNVVQARYLYGDGETQVLERTDASGNVQWLLTDHLGSVRDVANSTVVSGHIEYTAFGAVVPGSNNVGDNRLFTGLYLDQATGIVFADQRTLLVTTGQWMQEDRIMFEGDPSNLRRYVGNNVTNRLDPTGLWSLVDHQLLTESALTSVAVKLGIEAQDYVLIRAYILHGVFTQDRDHFSDLARHFNRPYDREIRDFDRGAETGNADAQSHRKAQGLYWARQYDSYLNSEMLVFTTSSNSHNPDQSLESLGRLVHSWQDFYGHAVRLDQGGLGFRVRDRSADRNGMWGSEDSYWPGFMAWSDAASPAFARATPYYHPGLIPSTYDSVYIAEHPPRKEPLIDGDREFQARYQAALEYTSTQLEKMLGPWYVQHRKELANLQKARIPNPVLNWQVDPTGFLDPIPYYPPEPK
jgi:RHS repeat-associated protein